MLVKSCDDIEYEEFLDLLAERGLITKDHAEYAKRYKNLVR